MKKTFLAAGIILTTLIIFWQIFLRDIELTGKAKLNWNAAQEEDVNNYRIYYGTSKRTADCPQGGYAQRKDVGKNTNFEIDGLKDGQTYYFSVTSLNSSGKESCFSEEMSKQIKITFLDKIRSLFN